MSLPEVFWITLAQLVVSGILLFFVARFTIKMQRAGASLWLRVGIEMSQLAVFIFIATLTGVIAVTTEDQLWVHGMGLISSVFTAAACYYGYRFIAAAADGVDELFGRAR